MPTKQVEIRINKSDLVTLQKSLSLYLDQSVQNLSQRFLKFMENNFARSLFESGLQLVIVD